MKRISILLAVLVLCAFSASATRISKNKAQAKAVSFFQKGMMKNLSSGAEVKFVKEYASSAEAPAAVFAFSRGKNVVFVSAEDKMPAILGYSENADVNNLPPAMEEMLRYYAHLTDAVRHGKIEAPKLYASEEKVDSLCMSSWYQEAPFWNMCPVVDGKNTATGCVATALAIILKYHNWPETPEGKTPAYTTRTKEIEMPEVDLSTHTYKWNDMIKYYKEGSYTEEQGQAVAQLMYDIGVASKMNYDEESGTPFVVAAEAMRTYFKYNKGFHLEYAMFHSEEEWVAMLKNEISQGRPLPYNAAKDSPLPSGHCFVVDGYNTDGLFHVNWGWGGRSNGYFLITTLDPKEEGVGGTDAKGGYVVGQSALFDFAPDREGTSTPIENFLFQYTQCAAVDGDNIKIMAFRNLSIEEFHGDVILQLVDKDGNVASKQTIKKDFHCAIEFNEDLNVCLGDYFDFSNFADGQYHTEMIVVSSATGKEYPVKRKEADHRIVIENGKLKTILRSAVLEGKINGYENVTYDSVNVTMTVKTEITNVDEIDYGVVDIESNLGLSAFVYCNDNSHYHDSYTAQIKKHIKPGETFTTEAEVKVGVCMFKDLENVMVRLSLVYENGTLVTKEYPLQEILSGCTTNININKVEGKSPAFSLDGKRVDASNAKGVIIKDGKKTVKSY